MFVRIRWFVYGAAMTVGLGFLVVKRARQLRERLDARGLKRASAHVAADSLERVGRRLQRSSLRVAPTGGEAETG